MPQKPPAFQFYAKDWISSETTRTMRRSDRGLYIDLLAYAWDSEEPGTLPNSIQKLSQITAIRPRDLRQFLAKFPQTFRQVGTRLVNEKLRSNYLNYLDISGKRKAAAEKRHANASECVVQMHQPASAPASAFVHTPVVRPRKVFEKPTPLQVFTEMQARKFPDPEVESSRFFAYHESKGWVVGRAPMKDWKAAIRTWQHNLGQFGGNGNGNGHKPNLFERNMQAGSEALRLAEERDREAASGDSNASRAGHSGSTH